MKIMTIIGTRPEIIRLSIIMKKLDEVCDHITVWTGQNYDDRLSKIFFEEFDIKGFNYNFQKMEILGESNTDKIYKNISYMIDMIGSAIEKEKPDKILILGDTNSSLAGAIIGERISVPVYHMEAGNRCYDMKVPEEKNRIMIDSISSFNLPYVENSRENLLQCGYPKNRIFKCGNPIYEVMIEHWPSYSGGIHVLVTAHRAENVDDPYRLLNIMNALKDIRNLINRKIIFSVHPRTRKKLKGLNYHFDGLEVCEPFNFSDFIQLERNSYCIITDSGTVQEEACILGKPCVIIRDSTERPETIEAGGHIVSGLEKDKIVECFKLVTSNNIECKMPDGYIERNVSDKVINFLLGKQL